MIITVGILEIVGSQRVVFGVSATAMEWKRKRSGIMFMQHCNVKFKSGDVWFLEDLKSNDPNKNFKERRLLVGTCPHCEKDLVSLVETRVSDGEYFVNTVWGKKAQKMMQQETPRIIYTENDLNSQQFKKKVQGGSMGLIQQ